MLSIKFTCSVSYILMQKRGELANYSCDIILAMNIPITQSKAWQKLQNDLGEKSFFRREKDYRFLAILKSTPVGNYLYCPYGPIAKDQDSFQTSLAVLLDLAKEHNAIFIRVEPFEAEFVSHLPENTKKSHDLNPKETWLLDLTGNDDDLKQRLPSRLCRYYRSAHKKGITIEASHNPADIIHLLRLQQALADKKGINTFSEHYLQTELKQPFATLYLVKYHDENTGKVEIIASGLVFDDDKTRYNLQGAQSDQGRKLHATGILTIKLILDAKEKGLKTFDFWGIAPEGAPDDHPWAGFTNFKKTFAGYQYNHAGTYDIIVNKQKYHLYSLLRKVNKHRRH